MITSCQYADDMWVVLSPEAETINALLIELQNFKEYSGLTVNYEKTTAFAVGPCKIEDFKYITKIQLAWTEEPVKILGIWFHKDMKIICQKNFRAALDKARKVTEVWKSRGISGLGKICIVNSLVSSLFAHILMSLPKPNNDFFKEYRQLVLEFIWDGKPHKIRYEKIIQNYNKGGLKLVDLESKYYALNAKWPLYFQEREEKWLYGNFDHRIWQSNTEHKDVQKICNDLKLSKSNAFRNIWEAWSKIFFEIPEEESAISGQNIWGNSCIKRAN